MSQLGRVSSQLELEAAHYFKIDPSQFCPNQMYSSDLSDASILNPQTASRSPRGHYQHSQAQRERCNHQHRKDKHQQTTMMSRNLHQNDQLAAVRPLNRPKPALNGQKEGSNRSSTKAVVMSVPKSRTTNRSQRAELINQSSTSVLNQSRTCHGPPLLKSMSPRATKSPATTPEKRSSTRRLDAPSNVHNDSSTTSTNSLPSISSSPSISPSIVCPHLSLDELLETRRDSSNTSPHTIGLCSRCRLDPPPNVHSPLSPMFRPFASGLRASAAKMNQSTGDLRSPGQSGANLGQTGRRGNSDQEASRYGKSRSLSNVCSRNVTRKQHNMRDDSLDFALGPNELRRMQMSPTIRNSVEFIRKNSTESGRVLRIHKNGEPFEKPLRVCIMRGEFTNIDHLLDHINTRLLVPLGARYLFHLDGQLVYSVEELKHGSVYVVSGTRVLDGRTSRQLKEQCEKEKQQQRAPNRNDQQPYSPSRSKSSIRDLGREYDHSQSIQSQDQQIVTRRNAESSTRNKSVSNRESSSHRSRVESGSLNREIECSDNTLRSCDSLNRAASLDDRPTKLTRAKSELSSLPKKRKKNVTFMDTSRVRSPTISKTDANLMSDDEEKTFVDKLVDESLSRTESTQIIFTEEKQSNQRTQALAKSKSATRYQRDKAAQPISVEDIKKEFSTSSVGIQVSDSIDGFLIDLPVALPARGDDSDLRHGKVPKRQAGQAGKSTARASQFSPKKRQQFVTITERQLSQDELNEFRDLSQGDHHHEPIIEESPLEDSLKKKDLPDDSIEAEVIPDRSQTISIGCDPRVDESTQTGPQNGALLRLGDSSRQISSGLAETRQDGKPGTGTGEHWHYPGGRTATATPTERPVSQSGPSETVRARVTTPTPSLSTLGAAGDEISLSVSYDTNSLGDSQPGASRPHKMPMKLPSKRRVEVTGNLCSGLFAPDRNFRLLWVNGFSINDLYPENSVSELQLLELETKAERGSGRVANGEGTHLTPQHSNRAASSIRDRPVRDFKPSSRYHNWICHSRRHNELVYPAGSLIVLWCQWTNEQRFYAKHTSNVSCVTLATLDLDLVASAQVCELYERPQISANIHLWSLSNLDTLAIIEDDQLKTKLIFSLRLTNTKSAGCELSVGARDEKQLLLSTFKRKLDQTNGTAEDGKKMEVSEPSRSLKRSSGSREQLMPNLSLRANKVIQSNQIPLFIMRVPSVSVKWDGNGKQQQVDAKCEPVICFGRRCFQIWSPDVRQQKLRLMQPDGKSTNFASLMAKSNCLCRLSPSELLAGDSDGNIALLATNLYNSNSLADLPKRMPAKSTPAQETREPKYGMETIILQGPLASTSVSGKLSSGASRSWAGVTSLARVTGSLFMSADASYAVRFWKIQQQANDMQSSEGTSIPTVKLSSDISSKGSGQIHCEQLASIALPPDLGFICTILVSNYNRADSVVEFYIVSTCNTILFGSVKFQLDQKSRPMERASARQELLANSSLSVVYEGHETTASSLVADFQLMTRAQMILNKSPRDSFYFTCSLDCRICKWNGRQLLWKSLLPSSCVSLAVHPNGFVLAVGSIDGTVYILDKVSGLLISYFPLTPVRINCLAYSSDGSLLAAGCSNGSIFILPVYERGLKYKKVSIFQSPNAVVSLQFSLDNRYMLTSVTHGSFQELILWDLPNFRYMRDNVKMIADKIRWFDSICSGSEDVRAIWENANLAASKEDILAQPGAQKRVPISSGKSTGGLKRAELNREGFVVNLSCHRLIKIDQPAGDTEPKQGNYVIASDTRGFLRLFRYPSYDVQQGFYAARISSSAVNCCRFLNAQSNVDGESIYFVSSSIDGSICLWSLE